MPIANAWHELTWSEVNQVPERAGVYELGDSGRSVIYIGSAGGGNLRQRLGQHINDTSNQCVRLNAKYFRYEVTEAYITRERELIDEYVRIHGRLPKCNTQRP